MPPDGDKTGRPGYDRVFLPPPDTIVDGGVFRLGCFSGPAARANMLDVQMPYHYPVPRWFKALRCKEWRAFQFGDSRFYAMAALYEGKTFSLVLFNAWDKERKKAYEFRKVLPPRSFGIGENLDGSEIAYRGRKFSLSMASPLSEGVVLVEVEAAKRGPRPAFSGSFRFAYNARQTAPCSACMPLGLNRALYSLKVLMPMEGWFETKDERYDFAAADSMGVLDDHKGYYPFRMRYDWVSGFGVDQKGRRVGFNLTHNQVKDQSLYNENLLWINSRAFPLPPVRVTRPQGPAGVWHIQDTEGLVDLLFKPERKHSIKLDTIVMAADYHGPFGSFEGVLRSPDGGEKVDAKTLYGMGEQKFLRA